MEKLYVEEDGAFYDLDADDKFVQVRGDLISRVCGEHVVDSKAFENVWTKQLHNPSAFWGKYPLASIAMDDPTFVRPIPRNSWGGASQALTALRAPRWMEFYGKAMELGQMMEAWSKALITDGTFRQQLDPDTGIFTDGGSKGYSPAALVLVDYTWRLAGVREEGDKVEWNVRPGCAAADGARFGLKLKSGKLAEMNYSASSCELRLSGRLLARVEGSGRVLTTSAGRGVHAVGIAETPQELKVSWAGGHVERVQLAANQSVALKG